MIRGVRSVQENDCDVHYCFYLVNLYNAADLGYIAGFEQVSMS